MEISHTYGLHSDVDSRESITVYDYFDPHNSFCNGNTLVVKTLPSDWLIRLSSSEGLTPLHSDSHDALNKTREWGVTAEKIILPWKVTRNVNVSQLFGPTPFTDGLFKAIYNCCEFLKDPVIV